MRTALLVGLASATWVYVLEALKQSRHVPQLHYRSHGWLWTLNVAGALVIGLALSPFALTFWSALVVEQLVYDGIVHRRTGSGGW